MRAGTATRDSWTCTVSCLRAAALQDLAGTEYVQAAVDTALDIHTTQPEGDILVFLTGQGEIEQVSDPACKVQGLGYRVSQPLS